MKAIVFDVDDTIYDLKLKTEKHFSFYVEIIYIPLAIFYTVIVKRGPD